MLSTVAKGRKEIPERIELWIATTLFIFAVFLLCTHYTRENFLVLLNETRELFRNSSFNFNLGRNFIFPLLLRYSFIYFSFLWLNFRTAQNLLKKRKIRRSTILILGFFLGGVLTFAITEYFLNEYHYYGQRNFKGLILLGLYDVVKFFLFFLVYSCIKHVNLFLVLFSKDLTAKWRVPSEGMIIFFLWVASLLLFMLAHVEVQVLVLWLIFSSFGILFCWYSFVTIPRHLARKFSFLSFWLAGFVRMFVLLVVVGLLTQLILMEEGITVPFTVFFAVFHLAVTLPIIWFFYIRTRMKDMEIYGLKERLHQTGATLGFFKAQINPHFLFNALNAIYATSLQENSKRTGDAISKLGNMMRFMLEENMQERISLEHEVQYLRSYIDLQRLRVDSDPLIEVRVRIPDHVPDLELPPMLLIPFVENSFKHGIDPSRFSLIEIDLSVVQGKLHFEVSNTKAPQKTVEERSRISHLGLKNVRERLLLIYPEGHHLNIIEDEEKFLVTLEVDLNKKGVG